MLFVAVCWIVCICLSQVFGRKGALCAADLKKIIRQTRNCAFDYLEKVAFHVENPMYNWFAANVTNTVAQFYADNFVGVEVFDCFSNDVIAIAPNGRIYDPSDSAAFSPTFYYDMMRTMALGLKSYLNSDTLQRYYITQVVRSRSGQLMIISIYLPTENFINCGMTECFNKR